MLGSSVEADARVLGVAQEIDVIEVWRGIPLILLCRGLCTQGL